MILAEHVIEIGEVTPISQAPFPSSFKQREVIRDQVDKMLEVGVIEPTNSPRASPVVIVRKKEGHGDFVRIIVD